MKLEAQQVDWSRLILFYGVLSIVLVVRKPPLVAAPAWAGNLNEGGDGIGNAFLFARGVF